MGKSRRSYQSGNQASLVSGGAPFFELLARLIREARHTIHLQFYIFEEDETGRLIASLLCEAAARGLDPDEEPALADLAYLLRQHTMGNRQRVWGDLKKVMVQSGLPTR